MGEIASPPTTAHAAPAKAPPTASDATNTTVAHRHVKLEPP